MTNLSSELLFELAKKCREKGHEYYEKGDQDKTAIFWEFETIFTELAKKLKP